MKKLGVPTAALTIMALTLFAAGCAHKPLLVSAAPPPPPPAPVAKASPAPPPPAPAPKPAPAPALTESSFADVYFDFDSYALRDDGKAALDKDAQLLREHPNADITIEGHCDERGTVEYNQALGEERANAARDYLLDAGVQAAQIKTVSYGKERPFCTEHNESCWQQNRRGHFVLTSHPAA